jgi:YVTN family beta-propeller protein
MLEQRLAQAARALERSVAEVDPVQRLQDLGRRRRRQQTITSALALAVAAAVLAGAVVAVGIVRRSSPQPVAGSTPTAPARVVATFPLGGNPMAMAVREADLWVVQNNPPWVNHWVTPTNPMTRESPTIALTAAPTRLVASQDAVWVLTPSDNHLLRIDPATTEVVATIGVRRGSSGLAVGAGAVWVSSSQEGTVVRIDPATNQVVASIPVGPAPGAMTVAGGVLWVALPDNGLARIDPASNRSTVVDVPGCCAGELAAGEGALWVANHRDGALVRVDPVTGRVAARIPLPKTTDQRPHQVAVGEGAVWVTSISPSRGTANLLWRVDPVSNQVTGTLDLGPTSAGAIANRVAAGNGAVWVGGSTQGSVLRLEPTVTSGRR